LYIRMTLKRFHILAAKNAKTDNAALSFCDMDLPPFRVDVNERRHEMG
jgi:hypothetical protein